ncbi:hypothetical protein [Aureimonas pseudogalii]|uniref:Lectin-like protein BA14k n=1 Tax=Aureimonas pseudogalii TaxID=1744844 RepID=A0A7W6H3D5_9HYPH|nr:hypothetical protein [Aureimonas pseudogalii]MBB3997936.1 hypothetical protein [Aureimonas pseudogalii]
MRLLSVAILGTGLCVGAVPASAVEGGAVSGGSFSHAYDRDVGYERTGSVTHIHPQSHQEPFSAASDLRGGSIRTVSGGNHWAEPLPYRSDRNWERGTLDEIDAARRGGRSEASSQRRQDALRRYDGAETGVRFSPGAVERGSFYGTSGIGGGSSFVVISAPAAEPPPPTLMKSREAGSDARIIDVASARLDRRPYGRDGLDVVYSGATKIIRIAPGFDRPGSTSHKDEAALAPVQNGTPFDELPAEDRQALIYPDEGSPAPADELMRAPARSPAAGPERVPTPTPAERTASAATAAPPAAATPAATGAEPWTEEWLRGCVARYPDFDASLGTYRDESGRRRFCTGEP